MDLRATGWSSTSKIFLPLFFDFERITLAPQQLSQQLFVGQKAGGINLAASLAMKFRRSCRKEIAVVRARQFLLAITKHFAECGIRFQNPAVELANPDSDRGPFEHRAEAQIGVVIEGRRKLGDDVHADVTLQEF
jgi:hypothetical protein